MTAFFVTSVPVPDVVGTAISGSGGRVICRPRPTPSRKSCTESPWRFCTTDAAALARSMVEPPPMATTTSRSFGDSLRNSFTRASTSATSGSSEATWKRCSGTAGLVNPDTICSIRPVRSSVLLPEISKIRPPSRAASFGSSVRRPQPKTI